MVIYLQDSLGDLFQRIYAERKQPNTVNELINKMLVLELI